MKQFFLLLQLFHAIYDQSIAYLIFSFFMPLKHNRKNMYHMEFLNKNGGSTCSSNSSYSKPINDFSKYTCMSR